MFSFVLNISTHFSVFLSKMLLFAVVQSQYAGLAQMLADPFLPELIQLTRQWVRRSKVSGKAQHNARAVAQTRLGKSCGSLGDIWVCVFVAWYNVWVGLKGSAQQTRLISESDYFWLITLAICSTNTGERHAPSGALENGWNVTEDYSDPTLKQMANPRL